jgi:hypothetical protein
MLYEFQATYRTKGEEGISPVQATTVLAKDEVQARAFFQATDIQLIWVERLRVFVPADQEVLNSAESAELLRMTEKGFYHLVHKGEFPAPKDGKHRIPRAFIMKRLFRNIGHREVAA